MVEVVGLAVKHVKFTSKKGEHRGTVVLLDSGDCITVWGIEAPLMEEATIKCNLPYTVKSLWRTKNA